MRKRRNGFGTAGSHGLGVSGGPGKSVPRPMTVADESEVIEIHRKSFRAASGIGFLKKAYYPTILDPSSTGFCFVEIHSGKVAGFLAGALDSRAWHKALVRRHVVGCLIAAVRVAFSGWSDLAQVLRPLRYFLSGSARREGCWIYFVAVDERYRNWGIAERLVRASVDHGRSRGLARCWVRTLKANDPMKRVLEKSGFRIHAVMSGQDDNRFIYFLDFRSSP